MHHPATTKKLAEFIRSDGYREKASHYKRMILLGEKIYGHRKDLNMTQEELAKKAESTQRIISQLENASYGSEQGIGQDLYERIANALEIDVDYLFSDKVDRKTFELFSYIGPKLDWQWDIMQFMKLPYFVDLELTKELGFQISNFEYVRLDYGPFDKKIYAYRSLFEDKKYNVEFSFIKDFTDAIDKALSNLPIKDGNKLKILSYETEPMRKLGATLGGKEGWNEKLVLND